MTPGIWTALAPLVAGQVSTDNPLWPYVMAITGLAGAVVAQWRENRRERELAEAKLAKVTLEYQRATRKQYERMISLVAAKERELFDAAIDFGQRLRAAEGDTDGSE